MSVVLAVVLTVALAAIVLWGILTLIVGLIFSDFRYAVMASAVAVGCLFGVIGVVVVIAFLVRLIWQAV